MIASKDFCKHVSAPAHQRAACRSFTTRIRPKTSHKVSRRTHGILVRSNIDDNSQFDDLTNRLSLLQRQLELSVLEENFELSTKLHNEILSLENQLSVDKQILFGLLKKIQNRNTSTREQLASVQALGDLGDPSALPALQNLLSDTEIGGAAEASMWTIFCKPPVHMEDLMLNGLKNMTRPETWDAAEKIFTELVASAPTFAEGYNKRATIYYLMSRHREAIEDCRLVLQLNPYHFGAASGQGMCYAALGQYKNAVASFQTAMDINPRLGHLKHHIMQLQELQERSERDD